MRSPPRRFPAAVAGAGGQTGLRAISWSPQCLHCGVDLLRPRLTRPDIIDITLGALIPLDNANKGNGLALRERAPRARAVGLATDVEPTRPQPVVQLAVRAPRHLGHLDACIELLVGWDHASSGYPILPVPVQVSPLRVCPPCRHIEPFLSSEVCRRY